MNYSSIAFIVVLGGDLVKSTEHLGIGYITAILRGKGYTVHVIEHNRKKTTEELIDFLRKENVFLVGFTTTVINIHEVLQISSAIKTELKEIRVILGGHVATFNSKEIITNAPSIDAIVRGEGEESVLKLAEAYLTCREPVGVAGITYRNNENQIIDNPDTPVIKDLDGLPFPARDQFINSPKKKQYMRICTSRGCVASCAFCSSFVTRKQKDHCWRGRSPENVVDEIEYLVKTYDFHTFDFIDSTFEDPGKAGKLRIRRIAEEIIRRKLDIKYNCCFRSENWSDDDHDLLNLLVRSGLEKVNVGLEAGSNKSLILFNKRARVDDHLRCIRILSMHPEIYITFGIIFFHPYQTLDDVRENADFLFNIGLGHITRHFLWRYEVYPETRLRKRLIADNLLDPDDICDDPYAYRYTDSNVARFAERMSHFLDNEIIWEMEIFDIVIHTYTYRLLLGFGYNDEITAMIIKFRDWVTAKRKEISDYNESFFYAWFNWAKNGWKDDDMKEASSYDIKSFLQEKYREIKVEQARLSLALYRKGIRLEKR